MISFMTPRYVQYLFLLVTLYDILATLSHNDGTLQDTSKFFEKVRLSISSHKVGALKWKRPPARFNYISRQQTSVNDSFNINFSKLQFSPCCFQNLSGHGTWQHVGSCLSCTCLGRCLIGVTYFC